MKQEISIRDNITKELFTLFKKHIGESNSIYVFDLFKKLFKEEFDGDKLEHYYYWNMMKMAISYLRKNSTCFPVASHRDGGAHYYIPTSHNESKTTLRRYKAMELGFRNARLNLEKYVNNKTHLKYNKQKLLLVSKN